MVWNSGCTSKRKPIRPESEPKYSTLKKQLMIYFETILRNYKETVSNIISCNTLFMYALIIFVYDVDFSTESKVAYLCLFCFSPLLHFMSSKTFVKLVFPIRNSPHTVSACKSRVRCWRREKQQV